MCVVSLTVVASVVSPPDARPDGMSLGGCLGGSLDDNTSLRKVAKDIPVADEEKVYLGAGEVKGGRFGVFREAIKPSSKATFSDFVLLCSADFIGKFTFLCNSGDDLGIKFL